LQPVLEGLIAQPEVLRQILIVDADSTDGTQAIVRRFAARDPRVASRLHALRTRLLRPSSACESSRNPAPGRSARQLPGGATPRSTTSTRALAATTRASPSCTASPQSSRKQNAAAASACRSAPPAYDIARTANIVARRARWTGRCASAYASFRHNVAIPERIESPALSDYLAVLSQAIFQAGLSWALIESKWPAYLRLFDGFNPNIVARYGEADVERILADGGVVRTKKKIDATIENAKTLLALDREHGTFKTYLCSFPSYEALATDLQKRFKFLGALSVYYTLFRTSEAVPRFEDWEKTVPGDHPRMREMIAHARATGWTG
jgi:3-methyladenine DNA glycosylase Tag